MIINLRKKWGAEIDHYVSEVRRHPAWWEKYDSGWDSEESDLEAIFFGSVFSVMPSGKYYVVGLTSNQSWRDVVQDYYFTELLEQKFEQQDWWVEAGEGDPTDLFLVRRSTNGEKTKKDPGPKTVQG